MNNFVRLLIVAGFVLSTGVGLAGEDLFSAPSAKREVDTSETSVLRLTIEDAAFLSLKNSRAFAVQRYEPEIRRAAEEVEESAFDPTLTGEISHGRVKGADDKTAEISSLDLGVEKRFATGTDIEAGLTTSARDSSLEDSARLGLSVTQQLLRGYGTEVNLARLRQAKLDTLATEYELRGFAQNLAAQSQLAFWDYLLARRKIEIVEDSLKLAEDQLDETRERIKVGRLPEVEEVAAKAQVAVRKEDLINAKSDAETKRLQLLRLTTSALDESWDRSVQAAAPPLEPKTKADLVADHVELAMGMRPEVNQARLELKRGELEVVKTDNGLLPKLEAFMTLGKTGYSRSFGGALEDIPSDGYDIAIGLRGELPWGNRQRKAEHRRSTFTRDQAEDAVDNLVQLAQLDVRLAHIEAERLKAQVTATAATRLLQEETLRAETEKYRVGRSTSLLVAAAQRNLLESKIAEVEASVNYNKALIELFRQDGSLLSRLGIEAPGDKGIQ